MIHSHEYDTFKRDCQILWEYRKGSDMVLTRDRLNELDRERNELMKKLRALEDEQLQRLSESDEGLSEEEKEFFEMRSLDITRRLDKINQIIEGAISRKHIFEKHQIEDLERRVGAYVDEVQKESPDIQRRQVLEELEKRYGRYDPPIRRIREPEPLAAEDNKKPATRTVPQALFFVKDGVSVEAQVSSGYFKTPFYAKVDGENHGYKALVELGWTLRDDKGNVIFDPEELELLKAAFIEKEKSTSLERFSEDTATLTTVNPISLSDKELSEVLKKISYFEEWFEEVKKFAYKQAVENGVCYDGFDIKTTTKLTYDDTKGVAKLIKEQFPDLYDACMNIKGAASVKKILGEENFKNVIEPHVKTEDVSKLVPVE